ncbi:hypothetical protein [Coleofasciculus sp. FACHB-T130]|uniref:hypothetical protein n=1 Tax=Cyanophyceae TaxID=3028117 RepID=UPI001688F52B|nr:hypothetical protein [Coleofasciculus sp. FACHB-T130]MBD1879068.1 hypothetical protein [Coleofasciculus sp. FACHB-T130]
MLAIDSDLKKAEAILLKKLQSDECSMSLYDVIDLLQSNEIPDPKRIAKEAIWKMVEEGKARFTNDWSIEAS